MTLVPGVEIKKGLLKTLSARVRESSGVLTLTGATYALYAANGTTPVIASTSATVAIPGPAAEVKATHVIDTSALALGDYFAEFILDTTAGFETIRIPVAVSLHGPAPVAVSAPPSRGNVATIRTLITADAEFVVNTATVQLLAPGALTLGDAQDVDLSDEGSGTAQTLAARVDFTTGGAYLAVWKWTIGGDQYTRTEPYFAPFTDISGLAINLQNSERGYAITPAVADTFTVAYWEQLQIKYPCLGAYDALTYADAVQIDRALAYMTAAGSLSISGRGGALGGLIMKQQGDTTYRYAPVSKTDLLAEWAQEAASALNYVSCIRADNIAQLNAFTPFSIIGSARDNFQYGANTLLDNVFAVLGTSPWALDNPGPFWGRFPGGSY